MYKKRKVEDESVIKSQRGKGGRKKTKEAVEAEDEMFTVAVTKTLMEEAKKAVVDNEDEQAYLFGIDWERIGHGKE